MNPHLYDQLIFHKGSNNLQWRKDSLFNKLCWESWTVTCKIIKIDYFLTPHTKINSKWIRDLNVRPETKTLLEENIGGTLFDIISLSNKFLDTSPQARETKAENKQMGLHQTERLLPEKETINKMKSLPTEWEKIFAYNISDKGLISKIQLKNEQRT